MRRTLAAAVAAFIVAAMAVIGINTAGSANALTVPGTTVTIPAIGAHFHGTWGDYTDSQRLAVLDKLAASHAEWVRIDLSWTNFEYYGKGQITNWVKTQADFLVNAANARGLKVMGSMWGTPPWANGNQSWNVPPTNPADYGSFMGWAAGYFKGRVAAWELWNEPNLDYFFQGHDLVKYTAMVKSAYPQIKAADPNAAVVAGVVSTVDPSLINTMYSAGIKGSFDVLAVHAYNGDKAPETPYVTGGPSYIDRVKEVRSTMLAKGDDKPIWLTETGWSTHTNTSTTASWARGVTEDQQADYLKRTITFLAQSHPYVKAMFWYTERNVNSTDVHEANFGLMRYDLSAKPSLTALTQYLEAAAVAPSTTTTAPPSTTTTTAPPSTTTTAPSTTTTTAPPSTTTTAPPSTTTTAPPSTTTTAPSTTTTTAPKTTTTTVKATTRTAPRKKGYKLISTDGQVYMFSATSAGAVTRFAVPAGHRIVASAGKPDGTGSWSVTENGAVLTTGTAPNLGGLDRLSLNRPIVGMAATSTGRGYWLVASDGGIFAFGDASFFGSTGGIRLNQPIVGMSSTPSGRGYWLVATDGGIFAFGDAGFYGSTGSIHLNKPIVGMAANPTGSGYWLVAADGGIFAFNVPFLGSTGSILLNRPIVGMVAAPSGRGYWFAASDGGIFAFGDAEFLGSGADTGATFTGMVPAA